MLLICEEKKVNCYFIYFSLAKGKKFKTFIRKLFFVAIYNFCWLNNEKITLTISDSFLWIVFEGGFL